VRRAAGIIMFFYTYVLKIVKDHRLYIGSSSNLIQRIKQHSCGEVEATKNRRPLILIYYEVCLVKHNAEKRERYFKTGFGRLFLKNRIKDD
jgi:putative endonuclease